MSLATRCPHVTSSVGVLSSDDLAQLLSLPSCEVCRRGPSSTNLWLCTFPSCYMMGCAEQRNDHSSQHQANNPTHCIQLNVSNLRAWCYSCQGEVVLTNNIPAVGGALGRQEQRETEGRGLLGLSNLGNTCYMNSALQCLSHTLPLTKFFLLCSELVPCNIKPALGQAYGKLMTELWRGEGGTRGGYVAPSGVLHAIKQAWPAFRGFQQHDAQEFLRCCMDQLHKELSMPVLESQEEGEGEERPGRQRKGQDTDSGLGSLSSRSASQMEEAAAFSDSASDPGSGGREQEEQLQDSLLETVRKVKPRRYRSIVTDVFDGVLESSVKCLTCDTVSRTRENFQDLSLPIPPSEAVLSSSSKEGQGWVGWAWDWITSWFYGPDVSLLDCLAYFFSADELSGDNMYSCEKCKKLRNGLKFSQVTLLPDTLCIHLKRFRHDLSFSSKVATRVTFPVSGLDMAPWLHPDSRPGSKTVYRLTGVVCHHGTAGGGHYTCYVRSRDQWFHCDDSLVTEVEEATVANSEAYVLFYTKENKEMERLREEVGRLSSEESESLVEHYIANYWLAKFYSMAEPGPIDNSSVICQHGGVLPNRSESAVSLTTAVPPAVWSLLHSKFGGSPAVHSLAVCQPCLVMARAEHQQKEFELQEFKLLHSQESQGEQCRDRYCVSAVWFRSWEAWVCGRAREPPGPLNNRALVKGEHSIRPHVDHFKFSEDIWLMFIALYGGGPEIVVLASGGVRVNARVSESGLAALRERFRLRAAGLIPDIQHQDASSQEASED